MTLDQKIESLLPKKDTIYTYEAMLTPVQEGYNDGIDQCATNLKKAFERGEICFVPSEEELITIITKFQEVEWIMTNYSDDNDEKIIDRRNRCAKAILSLLTKGVKE